MPHTGASLYGEALAFGAEYFLAYTAFVRDLARVHRGDVPLSATGASTTSVVSSASRADTERFACSPC